MASSPERPSLTTTFSSSRPAWIGQGSPLTSSRDISHLSRGLLCLEVGGRPAGRQASHHLAISVVPCTGSKSRGIPWRYCFMREITGRRRGFLHSGWVRALVLWRVSAQSRVSAPTLPLRTEPLCPGVLQAGPPGRSPGPPPWGFPDPGTEPAAPALQADGLPLSHRSWQREGLGASRLLPTQLPGLGFGVGVAQ